MIDDQADYLKYASSADLTNGIPPIVRPCVPQMVYIRDIMVFVTLRILPVKSVFPEDRFLGQTRVCPCLQLHRQIWLYGQP